MSYLVDTNIWLEMLLEQERAGEVRRFLQDADPALLHITEFSLYSVGIILLRGKQSAVFRLFFQDVIAGAGVNIVRLLPENMERLLTAAEQHALDFDDAYQYAAAERYNLIVVSFDSDFDRTDRGRKTPAQVLNE